MRSRVGDPPVQPPLWTALAETDPLARLGAGMRAPPPRRTTRRARFGAVGVVVSALRCLLETPFPLCACSRDRPRPSLGTGGAGLAAEILDCARTPCLQQFRRDPLKTRGRRAERSWTAN